MELEERIRIFSHVQSVARHFNVWRGTVESLIVFINYSLGENAVAPETLSNLLRREETQRALESHWETAFWRGGDKTYRLVCLAINDDADAARRRLSYFPSDPRRQCAWCQIDERQFADYDLKPELDLKRNIVPGRFLHEPCRRPWSQLRSLVERADAEPDKENLL